MTRRSIFLSIAIFLATSIFPATEIIVWDAFEGFLQDKFTEIVEDFNHQSNSYRIKLLYKGNYTETFNEGVWAFEKVFTRQTLRLKCLF